LLNWRVKDFDVMIVDSRSRLAQPSDARVCEPDVERLSSGPRFARFAAAMEADPTPQNQLLDGLSRSQRRAQPSAVAASTIHPLGDARLHTADPAKSTPGIAWLGIGSWTLFCAALFVSLLLRPDRDAFEQDVGLRSDRIQHRAIVSDVRPAADPTATSKELLPSNGQAVISAAPAAGPDLDASPAPQRTAEADLRMLIPQPTTPMAKSSEVYLCPGSNHLSIAQQLRALPRTLRTRAVSE
jgi:hypothetical protein